MSVWPRKMHIVVVAMARRGAAAKLQRKSAELYWHDVVENLISGVDGEYVAKWCLLSGVCSCISN